MFWVRRNTLFQSQVLGGAPMVVSVSIGLSCIKITSEIFGNGLHDLRRYYRYRSMPGVSRITSDMVKRLVHSARVFMACGVVSKYKCDCLRGVATRKCILYCELLISDGALHRQNNQLCFGLKWASEKEWSNSSESYKDLCRRSAILITTKIIFLFLAYEVSIIITIYEAFIMILSILTFISILIRYL